MKCHKVKGHGVTHVLNKRQLLCCRGITEEEERGGFWVGVTICTTGGHNFRIRSWAVYAGRGVGTW